MRLLLLTVAICACLTPSAFAGGSHFPAPPEVCQQGWYHDDLSEEEKLALNSACEELLTTLESSKTSLMEAEKLMYQQKEEAHKLKLEALEAAEELSWPDKEAAQKAAYAAYYQAKEAAYKQYEATKHQVLTAIKEAVMKFYSFLEELKKSHQDVSDRPQDKDQSDHEEKPQHENKAKGKFKLPKVCEEEVDEETQASLDAACETLALSLQETRVEYRKAIIKARKNFREARNLFEETMEEIEDNEELSEEAAQEARSSARVQFKRAKRSFKRAVRRAERNLRSDREEALDSFEETLVELGLD